MPQFPKVELPSRVKLAAICALVIPLLAGCIMSDNPLSTDKYQDDALLGHWQSNENPKNVIDLDVSRGVGGDYRVVETESNEGKPTVTTYSVTLTHGTRANYMNMDLPREKKPDGFMFFEYAVKDNKLTVKSNNFEKLKAEIKAHRLNGNFNETTWGNSMDIQDSGEKLLKLFDGPGGGEFFGEELLFARTESKTQSEISTLLQQQADAWNSGDLDKFMTAYLKSDDITFVSADGEVRGYTALEARYKKKYGDSKDTMGKLAFSDLQVEPLGANNALCIGHWHVERTGQPELHGIFSLALLKTNVGWKIIHDHTSVFAAKQG